LGIRLHSDEASLMDYNITGSSVTMARVGLIQVDGTLPNLALMKLSSFFKKRGDDVVFIDLSSFGIEKWFASKVFIGGSGYDLSKALPREIEEMVPDYERFGLDYSMGFTSRGCIRDCDFCIVREKEGTLKDADMEWIKHTKAVIMDNNFLASPKWIDKLQYFIDNDIKVNFNQGLDIRLINTGNAQLLFRTKSYDRKFRTRAYYFAFDDPKLEDIVRKKVEIMISCGFRPRWIMFYILCGFNTSHAQDLHRFEVIRDIGCIPYIMKHNDRKDDTWLNHFDRWVNRRYYQYVKFEEYKNGVLKKM